MAYIGAIVEADVVLDEEVLHVHDVKCVPLEPALLRLAAPLIHHHRQRDGLVPQLRAYRNKISSKWPTAIKIMCYPNRLDCWIPYYPVPGTAMWYCLIQNYLLEIRNHFL
jgi:hypothetical protein